MAIAIVKKLSMKVLVGNVKAQAKDLQVLTQWDQFVTPWWSLT